MIWPANKFGSSEDLNLVYALYYIKVSLLCRDLCYRTLQNLKSLDISKSAIRKFAVDGNNDGAWTHFGIMPNEPKKNRSRRKPLPLNDVGM